MLHMCIASPDSIVTSPATEWCRFPSVWAISCSKETLGGRELICASCHSLCFLVQRQTYAWAEALNMTVWPSGLRRWLQAPVRKGVGSNPTAVSLWYARGVAECRPTSARVALPRPTSQSTRRICHRPRCPVDVAQASPGLAALTWPRQERQAQTAASHDY